MRVYGGRGLQAIVPSNILHQHKFMSPLLVNYETVVCAPLCRFHINFEISTALIVHTLNALFQNSVWN